MKPEGGPPPGGNPGGKPPGAPGKPAGGNPPPNPGGGAITSSVKVSTARLGGDQLTSTTARGARKTGSTGEAWESWGRDGAADTSSRAGKGDGSSGAAASRSCDTRSRCERRGNTGTASLAQTSAWVSRRRRFDGKGYNVGASNDRQTQCPLLLLLDGLRAGR